MGRSEAPMRSCPIMAPGTSRYRPARRHHSASPRSIYGLSGEVCESRLWACLRDLGRQLIDELRGKAMPTQIGPAAGDGGSSARGRADGRRSSTYPMAPLPSRRAELTGSPIAHSAKLLTTEPALCQLASKPRLTRPGGKRCGASSTQRSHNLHQALRLKASGGIENGLWDRPCRPAQHSTRLF